MRNLLDFGTGPFTAESSEERRLAASFRLVGLDLSARWATRVTPVGQPVVVAPARQTALGQFASSSARLDGRLIQRSRP